jgi:4-hydroxybenzoate polyprenyltransferase
MDKAKFGAYLQLIRFDRPIGTLLLLWPTLWALWLAAGGIPDLQLLLIFAVGCLLMRSAGCIVNDYADRHVDGAVKRTRNRPLVTGALTPREALLFFGLLLLAAFALVLMTNALTVGLSFIAVLLASSYPFMKRYTHLPQVVLGAAFSWSIPMAFAAQTGELPRSLWLLYLGNLLWTVMYDTEYAMVDREDDLKIGIKSTAILFGDLDRAAVGVLQLLTLVSLAFAGLAFKLGLPYFASLVVVLGLFLWQQWAIRERDPARCFQAFLHNNYVGMVVFAGIALDYVLGASTPVQ